MSDAFPLPSRIPTPQEITDGDMVTADELGLPRDMRLALSLAECGFGLQSFERWHRWTTEAKTYIEQQNRAGLQDILSRCAAAGTHDISFGPDHQTWRWSPEFNGQPYDLDSILLFRKRYIEDHMHALRTGAKNLSGKWAQYQPDKIEALCRYNSPNQPAATNPNRSNYERSLVEAQRRLGETGVIDGGDSGVTFEDYRDPEPAGRFDAMPKGVVLHGSRSGSAGNPKQKEYLGTARYEQSNTLGLGWHATIGENVVAVHLTPQEWGWHALQASKVYMGVEFAQATVDEPITDAQVNAFCAWFKKYVAPAWPSLPLHFPSHAEVDREFNQQQGKTDAFPFGDPRMDDLRGRIMAQLEGTQPNPGVPDGPQFTLGFADLAARLGRDVVGDPLENEHSTSRDGHAVNHQLTTRGEMVYWMEANRCDFYPAA